MYYLINEMSAVDIYMGRVVSRHHTIEAAERADAKLQRAVKRYNGDSSYLPTTVRELTESYGVGDLVARAHAWEESD